MKSFALTLLVVAAACGSSPTSAPVAPSQPSSTAAPPISAAASIVGIKAGDTKQGAGFVVDGSGLIATSLETIHGESRIRVVLPGRDTEYPVTVIAGVDGRKGLALVRIATDGPLPAVRLGNSDAVPAGVRVHTFGPTGNVQEGTFRQARVLSPILTVLEVQATDPASWSGPLFNASGEVVGVIEASFPNQGLVIALPVNQLKQLMTEQISMSPEEFGKRTTEAAKQH